MMWIIHLSILGILALLFFRRFHSGFAAWIYWSALLIKLTAGVVLGLIFFNYYEQGDTIAFFSEAVKISQLPFSEFISNLFSPSTYATTNQPRVAFFTKFLAFFTLISGNSYWISSLYLSSISFFATWYLVTNLSRLLPHQKSIVTVCFLFLPTVVFWSSGILKDTIAFSALVFCVGIILKVHFRSRPHFMEWLLFGIALFILLKIKHYLLISLILFAGILLFSKLVQQKSLKLRVLALAAVVAAAIATQLIHPYLTFDRLALTLYETNQAILAKSPDENKLDIAIDSPTLNDVLQEVPQAVQIGLFRPSIFDHSTIWGWFHRLENTMLALLFVASLILWLKERPPIDGPLILAAISTILLLATMLALATPNFGTLVRYKNAFLPFLFVFCSTLPYHYFASKKMT